MKFILRLLVALALCTHLTAESGPQILAVDRAYLDPAISPCQDFYDYANGAFNKVAIPAAYSTWGVDREINERNYAVLKRILETSAQTRGPKGSVAQRVGDFYAAGMNEAAIERDGLKPLQPWFDELARLPTSTDLVRAIGHLQSQGFDVALGFGVQLDDKDTTTMIAGLAQGGLGLPERDYYFRPDARSEEIRQAYVACMAGLLELAGDSASAAKDSAIAIMGLETKLAKASRTLVERRDPEKNYHKLDRTALKQLSPEFPWDDFFTQVGFPATEKNVLVGQPEFFTALAGLLHSEPLSTWRAYLRWHLLNQSANYLGNAFVERRFAFYGKMLSGTTELRPRWQRVMAAVDEAVGEDLGQLYVQTTFSPSAKARALQMVKFHLEAMRERIRAADWMSDETKARAYKKIETMRTKIGYPDHWRDYSKLTITPESYVTNRVAAKAFEVRRQLGKLGQPVDRDEWEMTPQTNNAYYEPTLNEMCFPAGILQPPNFDEKADDAASYGALASTIGHELTHGFDDEGRQYDEAGNLHDWWTEADAKGFELRAELVAQQYDAFEVVDGMHINGHQTLGENIADVGGLRVAYEAYKLATADQKLQPIDGFTPDQRFFIAFAQSWRSNDRRESLRLQVTSNVHSPARWRVLGPLANFPEFRAAFGCKEPVNAWPAIW